jgi:hypothetical protein
MEIRESMSVVRIVVGLCLFVLVVSHTGCGPTYGGRKAIKGTVKLKGEPVDDGMIDFFPMSGNEETKSGAQIIKGAYKIPAEFGLLPGKYRVSISAGDGRTRANASPDQPPGPTGANIVSKDRIPKEYNIESKQEVDVTEKGPNEFNYDIP